MALNPALAALVSASRSKYQGGTGGDTIKPVEGRNVYRIINPTGAAAAWMKVEGMFWADCGVNWIKADLATSKPLAVVGDCEVVYGDPSVINAAILLAIDSAMDQASKELFESWKTRRSVLLNVIDRSKGDDVHVLELTPTTFSKYLEILEEYAKADVDITSATEGVDIVITRVGKGLNTEYSVMAAPGVSKPVTKAQMEKCTDLHAFIKGKFFRGDEQKALNAISTISGVVVPKLGAPRTPTPALTSSAATVEDAKVTTAVPDTSAADIAAAATAAAAVAAAEVKAAADKRRAEILKRQAEAAAELEALNEPTAAVVVETPVAATASGLSDEDAILAELDNIAG